MSASWPPHDQQKRFPLNTSARQCGQIRASRAPQSLQNFAPGGLSLWQWWHLVTRIFSQTPDDRSDVVGSSSWRAAATSAPSIATWRSINSAVSAERRSSHRMLSDGRLLRFCRHVNRPHSSPVGINHIRCKATGDPALSHLTNGGKFLSTGQDRPRNRPAQR